MKWFVLFIVLFAVVDGSTIKDLVEKQLKYKISTRNRGSCGLEILRQNGVSVDCNRTSVPHGDQCRLTPRSLNQTFVAKCDNGQWIPGATSTDHNSPTRAKRFIWWIIGGAIALVTVGILCTIFCGGKTEEKVKYPPVYNKCNPSDIKKSYYTAEGKTAIAVRWTTPTATDKDGSIKSDKQTSSPKNGDEFDGNTKGYTHTVTYQAEDNDGLEASCSFSFTVTVRYCDSLPWPKNGALACDKKNIYGSTCTYSCEEGYKLTNGSLSKCQHDGKWTVISSCTKVRCPEPQKLPNATFSCDDLGYLYQTTCSISCNMGFSLRGPGYIRCQADKTWSKDGEYSCEDVEPPALECVTPQIFYADFGVLTTSVKWMEPTVSDTVDPHPILRKINGPSQEDVLPVDSTFVIYQATDASGNVSPTCSIELRVQEISCEDPRTAFNDDKMSPSCTGSQYHYGVRCNISCLYNLPLNGTNNITCEKADINGVPTGYWDWGSEHRPYCREVTCPKLDPPKNGALVYDSVNQRPVAIVMCNINFDIPVLASRFDGQIFCHDSGTWFPLNKTPDCIEPHEPTRMRLPSELFYFSGHCPNETTLDEIKNSFLEILSTIVNPFFQTICPSNITCTTEFVTVKCGPVNGSLDSSRLRRNTEMGQRHMSHHITKREESHATIFRFDIITEFVQGNKTFAEATRVTDDLQNLQKEAFRSLVGNKSLDMDGFSTRPDSFQSAALGKITCDSGMLLDGVRCKPCPEGMYLNEEEEICKDCPVGQYQDMEGSMTCKMCPDGYSTLQTRSKLQSNCTKRCSPGSISATSLEPCSPCPVGTYQESVGQRVCLKCPSGLTTSEGGRYNSSHCQNFDIQVRDTNEGVHLGYINASKSVSLIFWARRVSGDTLSMATLKLKYGQESVLTINMFPTISASIRETFDTGVRLTTARWNHIAVVWNKISSAIQLYVNGAIHINETIPSPQFEYGSFAVSSSGADGIYLSGVHVLETALTEDDITPFLGTCILAIDGAIVSMDSFLQLKGRGIGVITPAICDAIDECESSPCGEHTCINEAGDFRCICTNGVSGRFCEIFPDYCIGSECLNEAICESHSTNYSCSCTEGYSGIFCEVPPVNGGWSSFGEWSECSASCDGGEKTRNRTCDRPKPGIGGLDCSGSSKENETCNTKPCRGCGEPWRSYGIIPNCTTEMGSDMKYCHPYCRNGTLLPSGLDQFDIYNCGSNTNYTWIPFDKFPACVDPIPPRRYSLDVAIDYTDAISHGDVMQVESRIKENLLKTDCYGLASCEMSVALDITGNRTNTDAGSTLQVSLAVPITHTGNLDADLYFSNGTLSESLQEIVDAIVALELTAAEIEANATELFNIESDGFNYSIKESTLTMSGESDCPKGSVTTDALCVECPTGTRSTSNLCSFCDVGTYQDETGQNTCKTCPSGFTTTEIGASSVLECTVECPIGTRSTSNLCSFCDIGTYQDETGQSTCKPCPSGFTTIEIGASSVLECTGTTTETPKVRKDVKTESPFTAGVIAAVAVGCTVAVISVLAIGILVCKTIISKRKSEIYRLKHLHATKNVGAMETSGHNGMRLSNLEPAGQIHTDPVSLGFSNNGYECLPSPNPK